MTLQQTLSDIITSLPDWSTRQLNEAQTSQAIVLRVLQALGYDIWNPFEVIPEETAVGGKKPDYIIALNGKPRFVIEVKRLDRTLDPDTKVQAVTYANNKGIRWAVLTDGSSWLLFDSFMQKQAQDRLVLTLSLRKQSVQLLANAFEKLLDIGVWDEEDADEALRKTASDVRNSLRLYEALQPLAEKLHAFMEKETIQEPERAANLLRRLGDWSEESYQLVEKNKKLFLDIFGSLQGEDDDREDRDQSRDRNDAAPLGSSPRPPDNRAPVISIDNAELAQVLRAGVEQTIAQEPSSKSSPIDAWIGGEPVRVRSWRDIHAGIAETYLLLGKAEALATSVQVYESTEERRKGSGEAYAPNAYRQLSNGRYLFVGYSANDHTKRSTELLQGLDAPSGIIEVIYKDERRQLP